MAALAGILGRMAAESGKMITWQEVEKHWSNYRLQIHNK